ncbi:zinc finger protein 185 isoform X32 [Brienomyrus brachyistius]|uniref:zinc finger protein 185 isoform X25 n=1 Tax=Brienomyrus brachyistius TaxID=42636 RepID=UPI0020B1E2EE|nr:zinc finger protein 185 isoform X25 [Brienomyrus brachyistius]XP_048883759.1 zinc finger protein 185 isoform X26 [Brienomyrus brachyistius]XP_048883763.1 zinc finger protein 185 isoform X30 [Brienomyrus brachyistius]XP_048883764.1 zinc finger protein 185 isoform X31 [Brienomyrus brachyistius]XP_048883765.1 zinc finger protein 185 isoform X32 [Brienomyrus brachyistius]
MSKEGDRQSVLRTTKVRTSLKGDSSWIQQRSEPQLEQQKSWLAEVKATPPILELSPPPSPTAASAATDPSSPTTTQAPKPSSGYLIRGVFTKTNNEKAPASNGTSAPSGTFVKKPTDSYKKIAPHIVRSGSSSSYVDDVTLSPEEQDKRTEAASNVLMSSAARQRSYVLSAAKKYESVEKPQDAGLPFVAKRVVINDDDDISHKDKGMDDMTPPVGSRQTVQSVPPSSSKLPVEPKPEITSVKTSPKDTQFVMEQKPKTEAAPAKTSSVETPKVPPAVVPAPVVSNSSVETPKVPPAVVSAPVVSTSPKESKPVVEQKPETPPVKSSSVETPKVPPAVAPAPVVSTSPKESKPVVEQKTETPPVKSSSVETPKVPPAVVPAPVVSTSPKESKPVVEQKTETPPVKSSSVETPKVPPAVVPAPVVSTSPKESKPVVEQKTETPPVKSSSVETPKVPPAVVPAPVVSTSSKDTKLVEMLKKPESPAVKACSAEASKAASDSSPAPTPSCSLKPLVEQKSPAINTSSVETPKVPPAVVPAPVVSSSSKDTKQVVGQKWTETSPVKASSPAKAEQAPESNKNIDNQDLISLAESGEKFLDPFPSVPESQKTQVDQKTSISLDKLADDVIPFSIKSISASESATAKEPTTTQSSTDPSPFKEPPKSTDISVMDLFDPFPVDPNKRSTTPVSPLKKTEDSFEEDLNDLCEDHENFTITVEKIEPHNPSPSSMDSSLETTSQEATPSETESKKGIVLLKEYVNTKPATGISNNDLFSGDYISSSVSSYNYSSPTSSSSTSSACTYCGLPVGSEAKITIEHLNISCHPACFKCGVCGKSMGDLLYSMFLHKGVVHCESCYAKTI